MGVENGYGRYASRSVGDKKTGRRPGQRRAASGGRRATLWSVRHVDMNATCSPCTQTQIHVLDELPSLYPHRYPVPSIAHAPPLLNHVHREPPAIGV